VPPRALGPRAVLLPHSSFPPLVTKRTQTHPRASPGRPFSPSSFLLPHSSFFPPFVYQTNPTSSAHREPWGTGPVLPSSFHLSASPDGPRPVCRWGTRRYHLRLLSARRIEWNPFFAKRLNERVLVLDGAMGTSVHSFDLPLSDFQGSKTARKSCRWTRPDVIGEIHERFLRVGCARSKPHHLRGPTRSCWRSSALVEQTRALNRISAESPAKACAKFTDRPDFVIGSMGPGTKLAPCAKPTFGVLEDSYAEQSRGLLEGGVDASAHRNLAGHPPVQAAIAGGRAGLRRRGPRRVPLMVQVTMETHRHHAGGDRHGRALVALEAFPQVEVIGLNAPPAPGDERARPLPERVLHPQAQRGAQRRACPWWSAASPTTPSRPRK